MFRDVALAIGLLACTLSWARPAVPPPKVASNAAERSVRGLRCDLMAQRYLNSGGSSVGSWRTTPFLPWRNSDRVS